MTVSKKRKYKLVDSLPEVVKYKKRKKKVISKKVQKRAILTLQIIILLYLIYSITFLIITITSILDVKDNEDKEMVTDSFIEDYQEITKQMVGSENGITIKEGNEAIQYMPENYQIGESIGQLSNHSDNIRKGEGMLSEAPYLAKMTIPKIGLEEDIHLGSTYELLIYTLGLVAGSDFPSSENNTSTIIAGHRGYLGVSNYFLYINNLELGDEIIVETSSEVLTYEVSNSIVVEPTEVDKVRRDEKESIITLVTCTPMFTWSDRLLVEGILKSTETK